jgi:hypothetical protein
MKYLQSMQIMKMLKIITPKKEKRTTRQLNKKKRIEQKRLIDNRKKEIRYLKRWIIIK